MALAGKEHQAETALVQQAVRAVKTYWVVQLQAGLQVMQVVWARLAVVAVVAVQLHQVEMLQIMVNLHTFT
jgi:hypothetical protein